MKLKLGLSSLAILALLGAGCASSNQNLDQAPQDQGASSDQTVTSTADQNATSTDAQTLTATTTTDETVSASSTSALPMRAEVDMSENGFTPDEVHIAVGGTVVFKNVGTKPVWPASGPHPIHTWYSKFDPKRGIMPGQTYEIDFPQEYIYPYHDHLMARHFGKVVVGNATTSIATVSK